MAGIHPIVVFSDSDIGAPPRLSPGRVQARWRRRASAWSPVPTFGKPERRGSGPGSRPSGHRSYQFLPNVISGVTLGMANALHGLDHGASPRDAGADRRVRGVPRRAGRRLRHRGRGAGAGADSPVVAPVLVSHELRQSAALARCVAHELRWARTVKGVDPTGHRGQHRHPSLAVWRSSPRCCSGCSAHRYRSSSSSRLPLRRGCG